MEKRVGGRKPPVIFVWEEIIQRKARVGDHAANWIVLAPNVQRGTYDRRWKRGDKERAARNDALLLPGLAHWKGRGCRKKRLGCWSKEGGNWKNGGRSNKGRREIKTLLIGERRNQDKDFGSGGGEKVDSEPKQTSMTKILLQHFIMGGKNVHRDGKSSKGRVQVVLTHLLFREWKSLLERFVETRTLVKEKRGGDKRKWDCTAIILIHFIGLKETRTHQVKCGT